MICSRCGKQIPDNAGRCSACGTGVATGVLTPPPGKSSTARTRPLPTDITMDAPTIIGGGGEPATMFASAADTPSSSDLEEQTTFIPSKPQTTFAGGDQPTMVPGFEASTQVFGGDGS